MAIILVAGLAALGLYHEGASVSNAAKPFSAGSAETTTFRWETSFEAALERSRKTGKPILIDFAASWCVPCQMMEKTVWSKHTVQNVISSNVVPLKIDIDNQQTLKLVQRYRIEYVPTVLLVDGSGNELDRLGFSSAEEIVAAVERVREDS